MFTVGFVHGTLMVPECFKLFLVVYLRSFFTNIYGTTAWYTEYFDSLTLLKMCPLLSIECFNLTDLTFDFRFHDQYFR